MGGSSDTTGLLVGCRGDDTIEFQMTLVCSLETDGTQYEVSVHLYVVSLFVAASALSLLAVPWPFPFGRRGLMMAAPPPRRRPRGGRQKKKVRAK